MGPLVALRSLRLWKPLSSTASWTTRRCTSTRQGQEAVDGSDHNNDSAVARDDSISSQEDNFGPKGLMVDDFRFIPVTKSHIIHCLSKTDAYSTTERKLEFQRLCRLMTTESAASFRHRSWELKQLYDQGMDPDKDTVPFKHRPGYGLKDELSVEV